MTVTIEKEVYSFNELDDQAKERARDWYRGLSDETDFECVIEDFVTIAEIIGITFDTHEVRLMSGKTRLEPNIWYRVSHCQGDGACFEGTYSHNGTSCAAIRDHAPQDEELHRIADELNRVQSARILLGKPTLDATIKHTGQYYHKHSVDIDVEEADDSEDAGLTIEEVTSDYDVIIECMRDMMRWLYEQLIAEADYLWSAEHVDEAIRANEYEFDELGRPN